MAIDAPLQPGHTFAAGDTLNAALLNKALELAVARVPTPVDVAQGGTGGSTAAVAQKNIQAMGRLEGWVQHSDAGTGVVLGTLPADCYVYDRKVHETVSFDGGTTNTMTIGYDADTDAIATTLDLNALATGIHSPTAGVLNGYNATSRSIEAYYAYTGTAPTVGKALVVILYFQVTTTP